jgi:asparagine synthase (glutamine-hydrolysing)
VKVALAGDGADELFGSYLSHRLAFPLTNLATYQTTGDANLIRPFEQKQDFLARFAHQPDWEWRSKLFVFDDAAKMALYSPDVAHALRGCSSREHLRAAFAGLDMNDPLNRILKAEFRGIFPDQVLAFVDRLSMAHSLEVRSAFLDTEFVSFVARLPGHLKIRQGETKYLLKRAAERYFPREMVYRPKEGFVMPINGWLVQKLEDYVRDTLGAAQLSRHGLFNVQRVQRLVHEFYAGTAEHANRLLNLLAFQEWYELYQPTVGTHGLARAA